MALLGVIDQIRGEELSADDIYVYILDDGYRARHTFPSTELSFNDCGQLTAREDGRKVRERPRGGVRTIDGRDEGAKKMNSITLMELDYTFRIYCTSIPGSQT